MDPVARLVRAWITNKFRTAKNSQNTERTLACTLLALIALSAVDPSLDELSHFRLVGAKADY
jgi:hypothetical protein